MSGATISRAARLGRIQRILDHEHIGSQAQLSELLQGDGISITQATLSRDLDELGARKVRGADGTARYRLPESDSGYDGPDASSVERLRKMLQELVTEIDQSYNTVVLRTPPGAAQFLASFIDRVGLGTVAGCIAGDDTIFVLAREPVTGEELSQFFRTQAKVVPT